jgi:hypothetical protein
MGRQKEILGEHKITYNGRVCPPINANVIKGIMARVICSCGNIVQSTTWRAHTYRRSCVDYHKLVGKVAEFKFVSRVLVDEMV